MTEEIKAEIKSPAVVVVSWTKLVVILGALGGALPLLQAAFGYYETRAQAVFHDVKDQSRENWTTHSIDSLKVLILKKWAYDCKREKIEDQTCADIVPQLQQAQQQEIDSYSKALEFEKKR